MPLPDADNAAVGSHHGDFLQEVPHRCFLFLFALVWKRRKKTPALCGQLCGMPQRAEGERPEPWIDSDGKPCSGVRGDQQVSTASQMQCAHFAGAVRFAGACCLCSAPQRIKKES